MFWHPEPVDLCNYAIIPKIDIGKLQVCLDRFKNESTEDHSVLAWGHSWDI